MVTRGALFDRPFGSKLLHTALVDSLWTREITLISSIYPCNLSSDDKHELTGLKRSKNPSPQSTVRESVRST